MAPIELTLTATATAAACAVPGVFLVLRRQTLIGDAIGHVLLLGVALGFYLAGLLSLSPGLRGNLVVVCATLVGVACVAIVETLERSRLVRSDAALGLVYPALFSIGVILVSRNFASIHLDVDAVLLGELVNAPLDRLSWAGRDLGPKSLWLLSGVFLMNVAFVAVFYKELKLTTFDPSLSHTLGFRTGALHYALMTLVSLTVVAAFDAAGAVLVVAFLVAPAACAYLLTDRLSAMIVIAAVAAALGAWWGCELAVAADANVAGAVAVVFGAMFGTTLMLAPRHGLAARALERVKLRGRLETGMLIVHLTHHEGTPEAAEECRPELLPEHLGWPEARVRRVVAATIDLGWVRREGELLTLTGAGRTAAAELLHEVR